MEDSELQALLSDLESDRVERKGSASDLEKIREAICAFANDLPNSGKPGVVFVGVKDDGTSAGLTVTDKLLTDLGGIKDEGNIQPFPSLVVQKRILGGCELAIVIVQPSDAPPVRLRGRALIRVGPRRSLATPEEEKRLSERRRSRDLPYDLQSLSSATVSDLDLLLFRQEYLPQAVAPDVLKENHRPIEDQLRSLRFLNTEGIPTVLGILVLGIDVRSFIPASYVQFLRIAGTELTDPIVDQKELDGPLSQILRRLDEVLELNLSRSSIVAGTSIEQRFSDYPLIALQQLCRNAVLHRTYDGTSAPIRLYWFSDRIEIHNPGGPYGQVTKTNFGVPGVTDYRNPHLAEAMKVLGFVQRFGLGISLAQREMEKNDNPKVEFQVEDSRIMALLRRRL
jgi:ATP-dependent DNA helicase RecG